MPALYQSVASGIDPWAVQQRISTSDARFALASSLMPVPGSSIMEYRSGVMASGDGGTTHLAGQVTPVSGMKVAVKPANVVINTPNSGPYMGAIGETVELTLKPASATANRIDIVLVRIYDDLNPAIGSASGQRKLAVEVWSGDDTTGTPSPPTIPLSAGWHPLAYIQVNANTTSLTTAMITDKRGPGLVARGGIRGLYGPDSVPGSTEFDAAGAYPGDPRWVHNAGFQHQVYYGANMGWRGVHNALVYNKGVTSNPGFTGGQQTKTICSVTIPDPGTPYMIYPTARVMLRQSLGSAIDTRISVAPTVSGDPAGIVNWTRTDSGPGTANPDTDAFHSANVPPIMFGEFHGPSTVRIELFGYRTPSNSYGWSLDDYTKTLLSVVVYPSTVQPGS